MDLSVVVPCYREEPMIPLLVERLEAVCDALPLKSEIILVDDGSPDETWAEIEKAANASRRLRGVRLAANRGHQSALTAGLAEARGDRILMLDADLQDPPEILPDMIALMDRGYDVVYGRRVERIGETAFKRASAHLFYRLINRISDVPIPQDTGDFRLVSRRALDAFLDMPEKARFVRGMFAWVGFRQIGIDYVRAPRAAGETKYPLKAMIRFAADAITGFSTRPLRLATGLSFISLAIAVAMAVYVFGSILFYQTAPGWASTLLAISFFSAMQLLALGIMGEYIGRLYQEAKGRPLYHVAERAEPGETSEREAAE
ncbi:MAG: glycosyltransferase family 2 protein [Rubricella sp.]